MYVRPKTIKLLEKNVKKNLDISLNNNVLAMTLKSQAVKSKNTQVGLHQTKKCLQSQ